MKARRASLWLALVLAAGCDRQEAAPAAASVAPPAPPSSAAAAPASAVSAPDAPPAVAARPLYYESDITDADLAGRTLREFALLRNTIYARAGNSFRKPWLDAHFRAQPWYAPRYPTDGFPEHLLSAVERWNVELIADFQRTGGR